MGLTWYCIIAKCRHLELILVKKLWIASHHGVNSCAAQKFRGKKEMAWFRPSPSLIKSLFKLSLNCMFCGKQKYLVKSLSTCNQRAKCDKKRRLLHGSTQYSYWTMRTLCSTCPLYCIDYPQASEYTVTAKKISESRVDLRSLTFCAHWWRY